MKKRFTYGQMEDKNFILFFASDLLEELSKKRDSLFSFGGQIPPMKNSDVILEITNLTPLGKEVIGSWFVGLKQNLKYLHQMKIENL